MIQNILVNPPKTGWRLQNESLAIELIEMREVNCRFLKALKHLTAEIEEQWKHFLDWGRGRDGYKKCRTELFWPKRVILALL